MDISQTFKYRKAGASDTILNIPLKNLGDNVTSNYNKSNSSNKKKKSHYQDQNSKIAIPLSNDDEGNSLLLFHMNLEEKMPSNKIRVGVSSDEATSQAQKKKKNKKKTEDAELSQYLHGPKRQNQGSKRRQNTPESQFNELLVNIID